jgi:hypothetical protein
MTVNDNADRPEQRSQLFMLRLWPEELGSGQIDWRGRVQHVNSGETRYFRDWPTLLAFLEGLLPKLDPEGIHLDEEEPSARR